MSTFVIYEDIFPIYVDPNQKVELVDGAYRGRDVKLWVDVMIDATPATNVWPWQFFYRRWYCEVHARVSIFPSNPDADQTWYHYYEQDFYASSLRRAFWKAWDVGDKVWDLMQADESKLPTDQPFERHSHPDQ